MNNGFQRITPQIATVLEALLNAPNCSAYGWTLTADTRVGGSTVYRILARCEEAGLASSRWTESSGQRFRRVYQLTPSGAEWVQMLLDDRKARKALRI